MFDTFIADSIIREMDNDTYAEESTLAISQYMSMQFYPAQYIESVISALGLMRKLSNTDLSFQLNHTHVTLFKASESCSEKVGGDQFAQYLLTLADNNIQQAVSRPLEIVSLRCSHFNILEQVDEIIRVLGKQ